MRLLAPLPTTSQVWISEENAYQRFVPGSTGWQAPRSGIAETEESSLVITGSCQAALLFSSVSPDVTRDDVRTLAEILVKQYSRTQTTSGGWVDVRALLDELGVSVLSRKIEDSSIRACCMVSPHHIPAIIHNEASPKFSKRIRPTIQPCPRTVSLDV